MIAGCCAIDAKEADARAGLGAPAASAVCPSCGRRGKPVETLTVKALLAVPLTDLRDVEYRFCGTAECPTVYFATDGEQEFGEAALRERVHQKHMEVDDVPVCYCFRHTPGTIRDEMRSTGRSTVVQRVTAGVQAAQCACEIRNPQGACCLGNVRTVVKRLEAQDAQAILPGGLGQERLEALSRRKQTQTP